MTNLKKEIEIRKEAYKLIIEWIIYLEALFGFIITFYFLWKWLI